LSYLNTFFGTQTGPQYSCQLFLENEEDSAKFRVVFKNRSSYTEAVHEKVEEWVKNNIDSWKQEKPSWFKIEKIPDSFLPSEILVTGGGSNRTRSTTSVREIVGSGDGAEDNQQQQQRSRRRVQPAIIE